MTALEQLRGLVEKWTKIAELNLPQLRLPTRDATMAVSGIERGAQETRKVCADELAALLPAIQEQIERTHAEALMAAAREARNNFVVGPHCLQDRILSLFPASSCIQAELRVAQARHNKAEVCRIHADLEAKQAKIAAEQDRGKGKAGDGN